MGETLLVWSLGGDLAEGFRGREWLLAPVGAVKLVAAASTGPVGLAGPASHPAGVLAGCSALDDLGGLNTAVGNLVLTGVLRPESCFDRLGMLGHAYLWDPLFLIWDAAVATGLLASRSPAAEPSDRCMRPDPTDGWLGRLPGDRDGG